MHSPVWRLLESDPFHYILPKRSAFVRYIGDVSLIYHRKTALLIL